MKPNHIDIADLVRRSQALAQGAGFTAGSFGGASQGDGALREVGGFGSNPGQLRMLEFLPDALPTGAPLVVALHGCSQTAGAYDRGTGWSSLAARQGFALLLPEQRLSNNPNRCFNWFNAGDIRRDQGEAASIREMVAHMVSRHRLDPRRIFVTGLSAGGAMTSVMLATYPEAFAAGAILAGLPYGAAQSMPEAFEAMTTGRPRPAADRAAAVRAASPHRGPWPRVAVWHGDSDITVRPANAEEILKQWRTLHGLDAASEAGAALGPAHRLTLWRGPDGTPLVEHHMIAGMGHGVPIATGAGTGSSEPPLGEIAPFILDVGVASTAAIAGFFGLAEAAPPAEVAAVAPPAASGRLHSITAISDDGIAEAAASRPREPSGGRPEEVPEASPPPQPAPAPKGWLRKLLTGVAPSRLAPPAAEPEQPAASRRIDPRRVLRRTLRAVGLLDR